ncbi:MAG: GtrA family protein [Oscillospiraceae bacterium]|nr:GtrA family protein [Oscillospiraceae bacterium]
MLNKIKPLLHKYAETLRYLFWGVMTVVVNTAVYYGLSLFTDDIAANTVAFIAAVMFAYFTNTLLVFRQKLSWKTFFSFWGMRIGTLLIDDGGMWLLLYWGWNNLIAKCLVNAIIIVLNYLFSKFIIYRKKGNE